jgi:predicted RNA binding protein YcfA (HicA-like mRNA interferase family)
VVPLHRELALGTLRGILRQAGISPDDFIEAL